MEEKLINFETAKLAKEKGLNIATQLQYKEEDGCITVLILSSMMAMGGFFSTYPASTQSLLQKWLRKKYKLHIEIIVKSCGWYYYNIKKYTGIENGWVLILTSKEDKMAARTNPAVLEEALQEGLKLIE